MFFRILIPCFFVLLHLFGNAQEKYRAVRWSRDEKMTPVPAFGAIKDQNGFMWFGTRGDGLFRFDGSQFKNYRHQTNNNNSISGNDIGGIIEDSLHNIWIGTGTGLSRYDISADTFKTVATFSEKRRLGVEYAFVPFWATKNEVFFWDYPGSQLVACNIHTLQKRQLAKISPDDIGKDLSDQYSIFDEKSNSIWIEHGQPGSPGGGLLQISLSTGEKKPLEWECFRNIPNDDHSFQGMRYDRRRHAIWISCTDGMVEFTITDKKFHHFAVIDSLVRLKDYHLWAGIEVDTMGHIWMATYPAGIVIYDPTSQTLMVPFPNDSTLQQQVSADNVMLYCDRDNVIWTGSWAAQNGIYQLIPFSPPVHIYTSESGKSNSLSNNFTVFIQDAGRGKIWIGTADGLNIFDPEIRLFQVLRKNDVQGIQANELHEIQPISIDTSTQKAWILTDRSGYYQMDMRSRKCVPIIFIDSNNQNLQNKGSFPQPFGDGAVVGADYGNRTLFFIGNANSLKVHQILSFPAGIIDEFRRASGDGHLLFLGRRDSASNLSYALLQGKWVRIHTPMDTIPWKYITFNKTDQTYWLNTESNLLHLSRDFRLIHSYSTNDGLPESEIGRVISDNQGNIWFTSNHSIHHLDTKTGRITVLTEKDGFQPNGFFPGLWLGKTASGDLYFPSGEFGKGFTRIVPDKYINTPPVVYVQSLKINDQPLPISRLINDQQEISLRYFENTITVETINVDFDSKGKGKFRYKLGESADWTNPPNNIVFYNNLSSGNYDLIMQASNENGFFGSATTLHIRIKPPWWQTWWAYTLFIITLASLLWAFIQYRSRTLRTKNIQLEEKVVHRTKELKHSLEELRETQTQLIQREKMASLGELTAGIAHEIQNPLNFVNNFSDLNTELIAEMKEELSRGNFEEAKVISNDLQINEKKINHHGKRADAIVKGMLQHSRASAGVKEPTDVNALADEYLRLSFHGMRAKDKTFNASIETNFDSTIGKINIIPQDVGRVLLNIYNNAFYAVHEKQKQLGDSFEPKVSVSTLFISAIDGSTPQAEIRIRDNGMGIPQKVLDKIFQPFFTTKPTGEGTGLGLSLSYDIVTKMHSGNLDVETREGEGTEFIIRLPI